MSAPLGDDELTVADFENATDEEISQLDGIVVDDRGRPRFTVEVVDNAGAKPFEE